MRRGVLVLAAVASVAGVSACKSEHHFEPPDRAARVRQAEMLYSSALFDTINWPTDSVRALDGNAVFAAKCRRCHGTLGRGVTDYAQARELKVPSLVEPGWPLAASIDSVRHTVFTGHAQGMPTFGVAGITLREIDAASYYVLNRLRPDVLGAGGGSK
jgi:mono/diheme cytochrome c family protein